MRVLLEGLLRVLYLFLAKHLCVVLALDLRQYFAVDFLPDLFLLHLVTTLFLLIGAQLRLLKNQVIVQHRQVPISAECSIQHICLVDSRSFNSIKVVLTCLDAPVTMGWLLCQHDLIQVIFFISRRFFRNLDTGRFLVVWVITACLCGEVGLAVLFHYVWEVLQLLGCVLAERLRSYKVGF